jgi:UDP-glucuronate 4-epimerase
MARPERGLASGGERFLVTGALGCIGAWILKRLVADGVPVCAFDRPDGSRHRVQLLMQEAALAHVDFVSGDVRDAEALEQVVVSQRITHVIHLAGLQSPFVNADPVLGAEVNVAGTTVVFEMAKRRRGQIAGLVYASSAAVWGSPDAYPPGPVADEAHPKPTNLYGVFKVANEGTARIYWQDHRVASIGLRPNVVLGPGRDQGFSSPPSKALLAAAVGQPFHMVWGGRTGLQYAPDVADLFIRAARDSREGSECYDLGGPEVGTDELVACIEREVPQSAGKITYDSGEWAKVEVSGRRLDAALGPTEWTPLDVAVRESLQIFRQAASRGVLDFQRILGLPANA